MDNNDKVPFSKDNVEKCLCAGCPVQVKSQCVRKESEKLGEILKKMEHDPISKEEAGKQIPKEYCSIGKASCKDLDPGQQCVCPNCPVWETYNLSDAKPMIYYCQDGRAE